MDIIETLIDALRCQDRNKLRIARHSLYLQGRQRVEDLCQNLQHENTDIVIEVTHILGMLQKEALPSLPSLLENSRSENVELRRATIATIGRIAQRPRDSLPVLARALVDDTDLLVRQHAAASIGMFGDAAVSVIEDLVAALYDNDATVRHFVLTSLLDINIVPVRVLPHLCRAVEQCDNSMQKGLREIIRRVDFVGQEQKIA